MKKKLITITIILGLLIGSFQVYAVMALDSDLITIIKGFIVRENSTDAIKKIEQKYKDEIEKYTLEEIESAIKDLEEYNKTQLAEAEKELQAKIDYLKEEIKTTIDEEKSVQKEIARKEITSAMDEIESSISQHLKDVLKNKKD